MARVRAGARENNATRETGKRGRVEVEVEVEVEYDNFKSPALVSSLEGQEMDLSKNGSFEQKKAGP